MQTNHGGGWLPISATRWSATRIAPSKIWEVREFIRPPGAAGALFDEMAATGALLAGRRTAEQVNHWGGDHHDGVRIFVVSHRPPDPAVTRSAHRFRRRGAIRAGRADHADVCACGWRALQGEAAGEGSDRELRLRAKVSVAVEAVSISGRWLR